MPGSDKLRKRGSYLLKLLKLRMKDLSKQFEDIMVASAFAEADDAETARQILQGKRRVLLGLRKENISEKTLLYAINACKRIGIGLDILYLSNDEIIPEEIKRFIARLNSEGISYRLIKKRGCLKKEILDYVKQKKNIDFVVINSSEDLDKDCREGTLSEDWHELKCPLVVVMDS